MFVFLDFVIVLALFVAIAGGYRLGFVARVMSWIGMAAGFVIAALILPFLVKTAGIATAPSRLFVVVMVVLTGALLGQMAGLFFGSRMSAAVPEGKLKIADKVFGSLFGVIGVALMLWLILPTAANVPGWSARQVRNSLIAQTVYADAPPPPNALRALRQLVDSSSYPSVLGDFAVTPEVGPPPAEVSLPADVVERVRASTVKVEGVACHRTQDGSGFAIGPDLIATNAHVVAGENRTSVLTPDGRTLSAVVVYFDPKRDIAFLSVPRYEPPALSIADAQVGERGAVFGHPGGQDQVVIHPASVSRRITAVGRDMYGGAPTRRDLLVLATSLQKGDSGGAMVNRTGEVVGMAFAIAPDKPDTAYALSADELRAALAAPRSGAVDTGDCIID